MIPGIGTIVNGVGVLVVGILSRVIFKKELKDFEDNLLPLGLLVLALGLRESLKSPDYVRLINFEISGFIFTLFAVIIGAVIGGYLGSTISKFITSKNLQRMFSVLLLFAAYRMYIGNNFSSRFEENILLYILIGILSGLGSGLLGIGGGIIRIPLLIFFGGIGNLAAQGVSLITAIPSSVAAVIPKLRDREFIKRGIIIGIFGIIGSIIGSNIAFALPQKTLNYAFATFLVLVSINMFFKKD